MNETKSLETAEIKVTTVEKSIEIEPQSGLTLEEAKGILEASFSVDNIEADEHEFGGKYNSYEARLNQVPQNGENGSFEGERGHSKFIPSDTTERGAACKGKLAELGKDGVEYKNLEPDFSEVSSATVTIDNMTGNRNDYQADGEWKAGNFSQADAKLAEQWNTQGKDGRTDWTDKDVYNFRKDPEQKYTWHERCDTNTMDLVPSEIHQCCKHLGGVSECKVRDAQNNGGEFDE